MLPSHTLPLTNSGVSSATQAQLPCMSGMPQRIRTPLVDITVEQHGSRADARRLLHNECHLGASVLLAGCDFRATWVLTGCYLLGVWS
jgi:hypothetical protein